MDKKVCFRNSVNIRNIINLKFVFHPNLSLRFQPYLYPGNTIGQVCGMMMMIVVKECVPLNILVKKEVESVQLIPIVRYSHLEN